jgi:transcriptional regulator GlxA family with amidase domain
MRNDAVEPDRHVAVFVPDGAHSSSVGVVIDAMQWMARQVEQQFDPAYRQPMRTRLKLLGLRGGSVQLAGRRELVLDGALDRTEVFRFVYLPSFECPDATAFDERLKRSTALIAWLQRQREQQTAVAASGASVLWLAEAGLLTNGRAAVPREFVPHFRRRHPRVHIETRQVVAEHDGVFTTAIPAGEWPLLVQLVEAVLAPQLARWLAVKAGLRRATGLDDGLADDPLVASAQFWLGERFAEPGLRISTLARHLAVSQTTLVRRFHRSLGITPRDYVRQLRVEAAKRMLETTRRTVQQIGLTVGYADTRAFRGVFRDLTGTSPLAWRRSAPG